MAVENPGRRPRVVSAASVNCSRRGPGGALALVLLEQLLAQADALGVTSTSSSSSMNSSACSSAVRTGGVSRMFSSVPAARMLVSCLALAD
jgi:hypothetical protein